MAFFFFFFKIVATQLTLAFQFCYVYCNCKQVKFSGVLFAFSAVIAVGWATGRASGL